MGLLLVGLGFLSLTAFAMYVRGCAFLDERDRVRPTRRMAPSGLAGTDAVFARRTRPDDA